MFFAPLSSEQLIKLKEDNTIHQAVLRTKFPLNNIQREHYLLKINKMYYQREGGRMLVAKQHFPACRHNTIMRLQGAVALMQTIQVTLTLRS